MHAKPIQTTQKSKAEPTIIPSRPPSPSPGRDHFHQPKPQHRPQPKPRRPPPQPQYNHYATTTAAYYPTTTGYNNQAPTTQTPYNAPGQGTSAAASSVASVGPHVGFCRDFDNRCKEWAKYCGMDEYVDDMCRLTCMRCKK